MMSQSVLGHVTAFAALLLACAPALAQPGFKGGTLEPPRPAPDFTLRTPDNKEFRLSRHRGEVVALTFGYTFCPDVCPTTLVELSHVRARLGAAARRLRVVFITVDPERDGPERLRAYMRVFDPTFVALSGTAAEVERVQQLYGVTARKRVVAGTAAAYLVDHSAFVYVVDAEGRLRLMFPFGTTIDDMTHDLQLLLQRR
jgi:protein SCO1/2